jgi:CRISPR-associated protein Cas1
VSTSEPAGPLGEEPVPISLVGHWVFCPRRAWLEAAGEQTDTAQVAVGATASPAVDDPVASRPTDMRAVEVGDPALGVVGRCDTLLVDRDGSLTVVEHKATPVRRRPVVTEPMRIQLALQVRALRAMGHRVAGQAVYFSSHHVRVPVELREDDHEAAARAVAAAREVIQAAVAPPPLEDDPRCDACSHLGVCLPDERKGGEVTRRVVVADPDTQVVHLATPGSRASVRDGRVIVRSQGEEIGTIPLERVQGVVVHGNVDLSGALIRELLWRSLTIVWATGTGRVVGWATPGWGPNGAARVRQHELAAFGRLDVAREMVSAKIANQATLLRRNGDAHATVDLLRRRQRESLACRSLPELLGVEGDAAARYFAAFNSMFQGRARAADISLPGRSGRPARDPVNAALNYAYALLLADAIRAVASCGLDPHAGFLHSSVRNKPALALDLCEELRAPVADSVVIGAFNTGELSPHDFSSVLGTTRLRDRGRRALIAAYERRVGTVFRHPVFGYRTSWRRAAEIQARMILGVIDGSQRRYRGIRIR